MTFGQAITAYWKNYAVFKGRSRRSAFWFAVLFTALVSMGVSILFPAHEVSNGWGFTYSSPSSARYLWSLATFLPSLGNAVRRLHDTGRSGWNICWVLLPIVGWIILIVRLAKEGDSGENKYGVDPKGSAPAATDHY